jgi:hypothetical protein
MHPTFFLGKTSNKITKHTCSFHSRDTYYFVDCDINLGGHAAGGYFINTSTLFGLIKTGGGFLSYAPKVSDI